MKNFKFAVLTISDRCSDARKEDNSGPILKQLINNCRENDCQFSVINSDVIPDDKNVIKEKLFRLCNQIEINCIVTTGGTGLTSRDVTPEAISEIIEKDVPGINIALTVSSLKFTPMAMLSRLRCGILNRTLIISFPGSPKACEECFDVIKPILKHAIEQLNDSEEVDNFHEKMIEKSQTKLLPASERPRQSPFKMISVIEALNTIVKEIELFFEQNSKITVSSRELHNYCNFVLSENIYATVPMPPFNASLKDGYAVISKDGDGLRSVICNPQLPGSVPDTVIEPGKCIRISTGAAVPSGADAIVQVEDTELIETDQKNEESIIKINVVPVVNQDIRPIGSDFPADPEIPLLAKNTLLSPINLGLIAAAGVESIEVYRRPIIAILSTGDEIVSAGELRPPSAIWDSNKTVLTSLLLNSNFEILDLGISLDNAKSIFLHLKKGLQWADVIISTGCVSMGERDILKQVLINDFNATIHFGRVDMKPGKPTTFATLKFNEKKKYIFALPGNPVSAFVTYKIFVEPSLKLLSGQYFNYVNQKLTPFDLHQRINCELCLADPYKIDTRPEFIRAQIIFTNENKSFLPTAKITDSNQMSSRLLNVKNANGLLCIEGSNSDDEYLNNGDIVEAILF